MDRRSLLVPGSTTPAQQDIPGPSSAPTGLDKYAPMPMEEGEIDSETDQDTSILELPAINRAHYVEVKSVQYVKMGHAPKIVAQDNNWDLEQAVREPKTIFQQTCNY